MRTLDGVRAIVDCGNHQVIPPGREGFSLQLIGSSFVLPCEKNLSGHLIVPIRNFPAERAPSSSSDEVLAFATARPSASEDPRGSPTLGPAGVDSGSPTVGGEVTAERKVTTGNSHGIQIAWVFNPQMGGRLNLLEQNRIRAPAMDQVMHSRGERDLLCRNSLLCTSLVLCGSS